MRLGLFLAAALATTCATNVPARAQMHDAYEVHNVAPDDVLNLRAEPNARAPLVGALTPAASGISVEQRAGGWHYVRSGSQAGWASGHFLRPEREYARETPPLPLQCVGTEPFWSLSFDGGQVRYQTPETKAAPAKFMAMPGRNHVNLWHLQIAGGAIASAIVEARQACSDGMSDRIFPMSARVIMRDGGLLSGCCDTK